MPTGCSDDKMPWNKYSTDPLEVKYLYGKLLFNASIKLI